MYDYPIAVPQSRAAWPREGKAIQPCALLQGDDLYFFFLSLLLILLYGRKYSTV
jgi:hypothetical protein